MLCVICLPAAAQSRSRLKHKIPKHKPVPCREGCVPPTSAPELTAPTPEDAAAQKELSALARALRNAEPGAYERLSAYAEKNSTNVWGRRAALALGYDGFTKNHTEQALGWLAKAKDDTLLREYVLYWTGQAEHALHRDADALAVFETIQRDYPNTAMKEQLLGALAPLAVSEGRAQEAIDALNSYSGTESKTALLLERAQAYEAARRFALAARDYQTIFYKYPLSDEGKAATKALARLKSALRKEFPYGTAEMQAQRAQLFFDAHQWRDARTEFQKLASMLRAPVNPVRQRAELRIAQCRVELRASPSAIASVATPDAGVDAERLYVLSQAWRSAKHDDKMFAAIDTLLAKYPSSPWAEEAFMAEGNYYWVQLDRQRAASYYQKLLDAFPAGKNVYNAEWRVAWVAFLSRDPQADEKLRLFLLKYPASANAPDTLYWLGREAERTGNPAHARTLYQFAADRFPQTYFGRLAMQRIAKLGPGDADPIDYLSRIPPASPLRPVDDPVPAAAAERWTRAQALRILAMDASAELELKNAFFATGSPRLMLEAAQAAFDQGHFGVGMAYARLAVPNFDSRKFNEVPLSAWKALYPLPYETALREECARNGIDPMLIAGLIRQESTFQADVVSYANAYGLMQLLPKTAHRLARELHVHYSAAKLFEPAYNLKLGTYYFKGLIDLTGSPEYALAAYNAGEDRIAAWKAERTYDEIPELVESIPFSQTREYVQIVLRNAELYRMIYASPGAAAGAPSR
jgi:soluble lytic murein transglycosylase